MTHKSAPRIAFQGALGAYSHEACLQAPPRHGPPSPADLRRRHSAAYAKAVPIWQLPVEKLYLRGRVADIHRAFAAKRACRIIGRGICGGTHQPPPPPMMAHGRRQALKTSNTWRAHMVLHPAGAQLAGLPMGITSEGAADSAGRRLILPCRIER